MPLPAVVVGVTTALSTLGITFTLVTVVGAVFAYLTDVYYNNSNSFQQDKHRECMEVQNNILGSLNSNLAAVLSDSMLVHEENYPYTPSVDIRPYFLSEKQTLKGNMFVLIKMLTGLDLSSNLNPLAGIDSIDKIDFDIPLLQTIIDKMDELYRIKISSNPDVYKTITEYIKDLSELDFNSMNKTDWEELFNNSFIYEVGHPEDVWNISQLIYAILNTGNIIYK